MRNKKILIIDDDLALSEILRGILEGNGYTCMECHDADGATEIVESFRPDLILLDYLLPSWNGGELCGAIKAIDGLERVPIIIMSAYSKVLLSLGDYGCDGLIEKPFEMSDLLKMVNNIMADPPSDSGLIPKIHRVFGKKH